MYNLLDAHPATVIIVVGSIMVTPFYVLGTYVFSGASAGKGIRIGSVFLLWGALMFWVCLSDLTRKVGPAGNLIVPVCWLMPSLILLWKKDWFLSHPLSQNWLIGLQLFRVIGAVFLIEMIQGHIPGIFAYPAGLGDVLVGLVALGVLLAYRDSGQIPTAAIFLVIGLGMADFISAFFFGITSSAGPLQLFTPDVTNDLLLFPTGMIPLFLVPYAIFFHTLSLLNYLKYDKQSFADGS